MKPFEPRMGRMTSSGSAAIEKLRSSAFAWQSAIFANVCSPSRRRNMRVMLLEDSRMSPESSKRA
jgi:hypothetical protein